jgi:hypothetical protein
MREKRNLAGEQRCTVGKLEEQLKGEGIPKTA